MANDDKLSKETINESIDDKDNQESNGEAESLLKQLHRAKKRLSSLELYNEELRGQLRLMNEKFHLAKQFIYENVSTQTDLSFDPSEGHLQLYGNSDLNFNQKTELTASKPQVFVDKVKQKEELNQFLEQIKASKANNETFSDYYYYSKTNTYFSRSTGWYYYPDSQTFYNPNDQRYYKYDDSTKQYKFFCNLDGTTITSSKTTTANKNSEKSKLNSIQSEDNVEEVEEGEINDEDNKNRDLTSISDMNENLEMTKNNSQLNSVVIESKPVLCRELQQTSSNDNVDNFERTNSNRHQRLAPFNKIAPCRLIVKKSDTLDVGSLLLISCMGGKIGQHFNCTVTIPDKTISQIHAEINYDSSRGIYTIQDLLSRNGTFVNGKKLGQLERNPLFHGDEISLSDCCHLVAHIHSYRDFTCPECEPTTNEWSKEMNNETVIYSNYLKTPRSTMKSLKRKYGLDSYVCDGEDNNNSQFANGYRDRAAERQRTVGSDCPYEKTAAGSALDMPLNDNNKGFQMLQKMGWESGQTLGKQDSISLSNRLSEPIDLDIRDRQRHGLGYEGS